MYIYSIEYKNNNIMVLNLHLYRKLKFEFYLGFNYLKIANDSLYIL